MAQILVVDDEIGIRELLSEILTDEGYDVWLAENARAARQIRHDKRPDLVLLDIWMPDTDGISLLKEWSIDGLLTMPVIMMSGHGTIDTAVEATRFGAIDFLEKPIALQKLLLTIKKALKHDISPTRQVITLAAFDRLPLIKDFRKRLEQASTKSPALLLKASTPAFTELCGRSLLSPHSPWLELSTITGPLTQEMLQQNATGILFVGDIATLGKMQQMNLAFAVERLEKYQLRLICGSTRPIQELSEQHWDSALLERLSSIWLCPPPLEAHTQEVPEIATLLLTLLVERGEIPLRRFTAGALNALRMHRWTGSWPELQNTIKNLALTALEEEIDTEDVTRQLKSSSQELHSTPSLLPFYEQPLRDARDAFERLYFEHHLQHENGNMTRIAEKSGLERTHLYRKLKQLGLSVGRRAEEPESPSTAKKIEA